MKALITGINGQDGSYLTEFLLGKGYEVCGLMRRLSVPNTEHIKHLINDIKIYDGDLLDAGSITRAVQDCQPDEVYNLAAQSFVATSWQQPILTGEITGLGAVRVLEALRCVKQDAKYYQASSSEMFGNTKDEFINENSPMWATSPYAIAKLYAHRMTINYRESYGMYTCNGILFNHESPRRGLEFVTRKIAYGVACIANGIVNSKMSNENKEPIVQNGKIRLGNLDASRDWGYAKDYVEAMWLMLQQEKPDDYIMATGVTSTIRDFVSKAFKVVGIDDWEKYIEQDPRFMRPSELRHLRGDASTTYAKLNWKPKTSIDELVKIMVEADLKLSAKIEK
jgi:GDPmannose 4,6-dehydratase